MQKKLFTVLISVVCLVTIVSIAYASHSVVVKSDPTATAKAWATGVQTRNGTLQYALMSPELQKKNYQLFVDNNWSTGTSSPWIVKYTVVEREKIDATTYIYDIEYTFSDSTKATFITSETIVVKKYGDNWLVACTEQTADIQGQITEITVKDGNLRIFIKGTKTVGSYDKAYVAVTDETKIYQGWTDELLSSDQLTKGLTVEVVFSGPALMSYPIQVGAGSIRVFTQ